MVASLNVQENGGIRGAPLLRALRGNITLVDVKFGGTSVTRREAKEIDKLVLRNRDLPAQWRAANLLVRSEAPAVQA